MAKERALDVFWLLGELDRKNYHLWDQLTDEQRKEFSPLVTLRWMAGCTDPLQLVLLNEVVNPTVFPLGQHKELLLKLLAVCSNGTSKRYSWVNYKGREKVQKLAVKLISEYYLLTDKKAESTLRLFSTAELLELAEVAGWQKDEIAALKKELE